MACRLLPLAMAGLLVSLAACAGGEPRASQRATVAPTPTPMPTPTLQVPPTSTPAAKASADTRRDLVFAHATWSGEPLKLDLYVPADAAGAPIVITDEPAIVPSLVDKGALVVSFDPGAYPYDTAEDFVRDHGVVIRANAEEYACAIRFARARAAELGNDDPAVVLTGFSVDGGRAAHVALFGATLEARWDEFAAAGGPARQVQCEVTDRSTDVDGLVGMSGGYDMFVPIYDGKWGRAWQLTADPGLQRFLASAVGANPDLKVRLFHGTVDGVIPMEYSVQFEAALSAAGYDTKLVTFVGGHVPAPVDVSVTTVMDLVRSPAP